MIKYFILVLLSGSFLYACTNSQANSNDKNPAIASNASKNNKKNSRTIANAETILTRPQVPVLCYHHIRSARVWESAAMKSYSVSPQSFAEQMKTLSDSGYHTVLPDELYNYLAYGDALPSKPVMISFDDTDLEQFTIGYTEMKKYNFKAVYFIMTISIGRKRYMTREMIKQLSDEGNLIQGHTWDHHMVTKYTAEDWDKQLTQANTTIENITGKKIDYFAYPFGLWNTDAIPVLKERNMTMAFQLSTKRDSTEPLYTVRRMIVPGTWSTPGLLKSMQVTFSH